MSSRASGGALAASLITAAIVGFVGGAYVGTQSGGSGAEAASDETPAATDDANAPTGDPTADSPSPSPTDSGLNLTAAKESVAANERFDLTGAIEPAEEGVQLRLERSVDGGEWSEFDLSTPLTTDAGGSFRTWVITGREGVNSFRVVRTDDDSVVSNEVEVTVG